jgi:hypothetical protein
MGCNIMRDVMAKRSSHFDADGVPSFEYDARSESQLVLEVRERGRLQRLKNRLLVYAAGTTCTVKELFNRHSHNGRCRPFTLTNYADALRQLEAEGKIKVRRVPRGRQIRRIRPTMPQDAKVTFPRRK